MIPLDYYLTRAAEFLAQADGDTEPLMKAEFENLAKAYLRLAGLAKKNARTDIVYEPPPPKIDGPKA